MCANGRVVCVRPNMRMSGDGVFKVVVLRGVDIIRGDGAEGVTVMTRHNAQREMRGEKT